ncbi:hypothetical protein [Rhizobium sp. 007]|uniref:hypothetical protein n=1 Tax=Rhizobium sp. 007 TaxID=2785056 RepID=UPI00188E57EF|nr:hypothetical protein [Rhizobium sp. 007]QPB20370.1 hypothetical protein ISN39_02290 [Rhizobium sp. 007]
MSVPSQENGSGAVNLAVRAAMFETLIIFEVDINNISEEQLKKLTPVRRWSNHIATQHAKIRWIATR